MLRAVFGSKNDDSPQVPLGADGRTLQLTPAAFDVHFPGNDNRSLRRKK